MKNKSKKNIFGKLIYFGFIIFITASILTSCNKVTSVNYILIYNGEVADKYGVEKVAQLAEEQGFTVEYISKLKNLPKMLEGAKAFIIGGTEDETSGLLNDLYKVQDELKSYIENGGNYLGICGGAYVASTGSQWDDGYEKGMGIVDIESFAYDKLNSNPQIISITWLGTQRTIYYQYGPAFAKNTIPANSKILAYYNNENQDVAIFKTTLGKGTIIFCGPHPEADETWLIDDPKPLNADTWTQTKDIFISVLQDLFLENK